MTPTTTTRTSNWTRIFDRAVDDGIRAALEGPAGRTADRRTGTRPTA